MAVEKMKLVEVIGKLGDLDKTIEICCETGKFQPESAILHIANIKGFIPLIEDNPYVAPLQLLKETAMASNKVFNYRNYDIDTDMSLVDDLIECMSDRLKKLQVRNSSLTDDINSMKCSCEQLKHFFDLDVSLNEVFACKFTKVRFGRLPVESYQKLQEYIDNPYVFFVACSHDANDYWGVYLAPEEQIAEIDRIFASLYFERLHLPNSSGSPQQTVSQFENEIKEKEAELENVEKEISLIWDSEFEKCEEIYSYLKDKKKMFSLRKHAVKYNDKFYFLGWIPQSSSKSLQKFLTALDVESKIVDPDMKLSIPPSKLKNPKIFKNFEFFVDMYGLPSYDEIDPTPIVAISYVIFFGLMFADLGQGLCISLIGFLMWKFKNIQLGKALIPCGIASAIFGTVFGSVFGFEHLLDGFYQKIFNLPEKPVDVMYYETTTTLLGLSIVFGVVLILITMILNVISSLRRKRYGEALFGCNGLSGLVFYGSTIGLCVCQFLFNINVLTPVTVILLIALPLLLMFLREPLGSLVEGKTSHEKEGILPFITQNFFEVFEFILSYLSNTVSFLRVSAFILVHAGMMLAVFTLAEMLSGVGFVIAVILGNIFVIAMEGLLVGIQSLRLVYYELLSRFYEGNGREYRPITIKKNKKIRRVYNG